MADRYCMIHLQNLSITTLEVLSKQDVKKSFTKENVGKSVGLDGVCNKLLKVCAPQLSQVHSTLIACSLKDGIVPGA